ncbi:MAG TPA: hypothetical protein VJV22_00350 [Acidobacteriaceae bacterium]|nr:hypothetical protein [Acidobacteriaceae bacterium]
MKEPVEHSPDFIRDQLNALKIARVCEAKIARNNQLRIYLADRSAGSEEELTELALRAPASAFRDIAGDRDGRSS